MNDIVCGAHGQQPACCEACINETLAAGARDAERKAVAAIVEDLREEGKKLTREGETCLGDGLQYAARRIERGDWRKGAT